MTFFTQFDKLIIKLFIDITDKRILDILYCELTLSQVNVQRNSQTVHSQYWVVISSNLSGIN